MRLLPFTFSAHSMVQDQEPMYARVQIAAFRPFHASIFREEGALAQKLRLRSAASRFIGPPISEGWSEMTDIDLEGYTPSSDEDFMNPKQKAYFRAKLEGWKDEILSGAKTTISNLQSQSSNHPDLVDRASVESDKALELRTRDRQRKLISKIDAALRRIDDGTYGYCDETGEPIGLRRLEARPTATLSLEAQERHERNERIVRDD